jgi:hypothetical protein
LTGDEWVLHREAIPVAQDVTLEVGRVLVRVGVAEDDADGRGSFAAVDQSKSDRD